MIFDLFNTLVPGADTERDQVLERMADVVGVDAAAFVRAHHETWPDRLVRWGAAETIRILAGRLGASPAPAAVERAVTLRCELGTKLLADVTPATLAALDALRARGFRLALCSNTSAETADLWPASPLAARFAATAFSPQVGAAKPDPRSYLAATDALGVRPDQCWFVGDGADGELAGAAAVGMAVIRTTEFQDTDPTWPGRPVTALSELADRLG